ncbi:pyrroline-5-carboxylate reductase [Dysosmobacter sp.]|uniref:pyrroline-5-carboxylate reductase n=1 Tax=Dysosmobacter sp. TaxID=2591382 RepID=UPI002A8C0EB6|nr:pyrroline-5-carboxylate reductase [Dysosmobacter sp.]MDY3282488.1 pyrroline-5-carboxylate reductase [Dysosmobacter sp.]
MVDKKIGFIGAGTMAFAIMRGMINKNVVAADNIYMYDIAAERLQSIAAEYGVHAVSGNNELADLCDILIVAVKPYVVEKALADMKEHLRPEQIVMSIVGGFSTKRLKACLEGRARALKIMPNTPAQVSAGVMLISNDNDLSPEELAMVKELLSSSGLVETLDEDKLYAFSAVGGTIPAFVAMYVEALADAGVLNGMQRDMAIRIAAQSVMGSAKLIVDTGVHPAQAKDMVCTPAGITIQGVYELEKMGFRGIVMRASTASAQMNKELMGK